MTSISHLRRSPVAHWLAALALLALLAVPAPTLAKVYLSGNGGGEGDPVDSNDQDPDGIGGGGGSDDDVHDTLGVQPSPRRPVLPGLLHGVRLIIVPGGGGLPTIHLLFVPVGLPTAPEGAHAR